MSSGSNDIRTTTCFDKYNFACVNTNVKDADVFTAFVVYILLAFLLVVLFGMLRHNIPIYSGRCYLSSLNMSGNAPPPLPKFNERKKRSILKHWVVHVFGWVSHVMNVSDTELVNSSGLDALVFLRVAQFGTQLFVPITVLGLIMLCPMHYSQSFYIDALREMYVNATDAVNSDENYLMGLTIANVEPTSDIFWVHVLFSWFVTLYTLWLLKHHYRSYEFLRQVYGSSTGECNVWRTMHLPQTTLQRLLQQGTSETAEFGINVIQPVEKQEKYDVENRMSGDQDDLNRTSSRNLGDGSVRKGATNPFTARVSKTLAEIADIVAGPNDYEENDYIKFNLKGGGGDSDLLHTQRSGMSNVSTGSGRRSSMDVDDASWPILLEAMLGPGFNGSVISPTASGGNFHTPIWSENRFSTPVTSINADQNNFIRRSSLPTSPTGTMMESGAEDKSQPGIYTNDNNIGKLNSPESMASPTSVSSDASGGSENAKSSAAKSIIPKGSLDLRLSNYVTTRPKGSDVATRYHKNDKQHLTKKEERERQKRQLYEERQQSSQRYEENNNDTYTADIKKQAVPAPIAIPRPTGRESESVTPGELSTASSMGPLSPLSPTDALRETPGSVKSKNVHNATALNDDLPVKLKRPESPNDFLRMPSVENLNEAIIHGYDNMNRIVSSEKLENSGNVRTELQALQENLSQIVEDFTDYDELEDTHSIAHNWWVGLDIAETVWANNTNVKNSENLWDDIECRTCDQDGENNIPSTPTQARVRGHMHKSRSKDIELQHLSPQIRSDDSYGQDLSDLAEKAMMNENPSSSRMSPHHSPSKVISHHVVTPTKGAEDGNNLLFPNASSAQNTPTRKTHRRRPSGMDFENEKVKTQTMETAVGVYDDPYQFAKCCPVPSVDDRRFVSAVHFVDADELDKEFAGEGNILNNGDTNIQQREKIVSVLVQNYCVLMTDIGDSQGRGDPWDDLQHVEKFFRGLFGADFLRVIPLHDHERVDYLLTVRDEIKNSRDRLMMTRKIGDMYERAGKGSKASNRREQLTKKLNAIDTEILRERRAALFKGPGPSCVIAFRSQYAAACAAQCRITSRGTSFQIQPAPGPDDINWQTVLLRKKERNRRSLFVLPLIVIIIFIPMGTFAGVLNTLCANDISSSSVSEATTLEFMNWYCKSKDARIIKIIVGSILPPILLTLWETFIMSFGLLYLVQAQTTHVSLSKTDQQFTKCYFLWAFLNIFLGTVFGFAFERYLTALETEGPDEMLTLLGSSLPLTSNFFLIWILFRGIYLPSQRLIFPHPGVLCMAVNKFCCCLGCAVTPHDRTVKYSPRSVRAGREVGVFVMVMLIGLVFAPVAPIISLLSTIFFVFNFIIWRYHILYVYDKTYESSGSMWQTVTDLTIYALLIAQSFLSFVLLSKRAYAPSLVLWVTSVPVLIQNKAKFRMRHEKLKWAVPFPQAAVAPRVEFDPVAYRHPALNENSFGWHPDVGKVWRGYKDVTSKRAFGRKFRYTPPS